jgi:hypothetical protein
MIIKNTPGDILSSKNKKDVIIGMNTTLGQVKGIGLPFTWRVTDPKPLALGSVYSFHMDRGQQLHMIICHELRKGGWEDSEKYIRFGMDYLWHRDGAKRRFSMVQIGTGRIGKRDGADFGAISTAISTSHLPVELYIFDPYERQAQESHAAVVPPSLVAFRRWNMGTGEQLLEVA